RSPSRYRMGMEIRPQPIAASSRSTAIRRRAARTDSTSPPPPAPTQTIVLPAKSENASGFATICPRSVAVGGLRGRRRRSGPGPLGRWGGQEGRARAEDLEGGGGLHECGKSHLSAGPLPP